MAAEMAEATDAAAFEAEAFAERIAECDDLAAVQALDAEFESGRPRSPST